MALPFSLLAFNPESLRKKRALSPVMSGAAGRKYYVRLLIITLPRSRPSDIMVSINENLHPGGIVCAIAAWERPGWRSPGRLRRHPHHPPSFRGRAGPAPGPGPGNQFLRYRPSLRGQRGKDRAGLCREAPSDDSGQQDHKAGPPGRQGRSGIKSAPPAHRLPRPLPVHQVSQETDWQTITGPDGALEA